MKTKNLILYCAAAGIFLGGALENLQAQTQPWQSSGSNLYYNNGNVGIGTSNPTSKLTVNGEILSSRIFASHSAPDIGGAVCLVNEAKILPGQAQTWAIYNMTGRYGNSLQFWAYDNFGCGGGLCHPRLTIMDNGNVGIGVDNPAYKLDTKGTIRITSENNIDGNFTAIKIGKPHDSGNINIPVGEVAGYYDIDFYTWRDIVPNQTGARIRALRINRYQNNNALIQGMDLAFHTSYGDSDLAVERMRITHSGNVGIGTTKATSKLTVAGDVYAREVKVDLNAGADFVFASDYRLRPLPEVERFISENKHLPDIAPADSMVQNGVNMGEMQIQLLQKIEELTLYMIEQEKRNERLEKQVQAQQKRIEELENFNR